MIGRIQYSRGRRREEPKIEVLSGLTVLALPFYESDGTGRKRMERHIRRLEQAFRRGEISRVIVPDSFPHRNLLRLTRPVDPLPLYRGAADLLTLEILSRKGVLPGRARIALAGPRLCPELCGAAERLCSTVRELRIDVPGSEGENFARYLQFEFGVPVIPKGSAADAVISFGESGEPCDLRLWGETGVRLEAEGIELPEEISQPVLALLWERGSIKREKLRVTNLP